MAWANRGAAHRPVVMGTRGMVSSAHPLASLAGLRVLVQGGNAVDAAVATAAALDVCEPYMSGLGGAGYLLLYTAADRRLRALDYVPPAPRAATPAAFADPAAKERGPRASLLPGAPAGWLTALEAFGRLDRATVFAPAIEYAEGGVPFTLKNAAFFADAVERLTPEARAVFLPGGAVPAPGAILRQPRLAATYRELAAGGREAFYRGALAERLVRFLGAQGGLLTAEDFAAYEPEWQETVGTTYRGYEIRTLRPPCSGFQYLETLNILAGFDLAAAGQNSAATIHLMAEAMKLAVADRVAYAALPHPPLAGLLSPDYAADRRAEIDLARARPSGGERYGEAAVAGALAPGRPGDASRECTTHFDVVDTEGNAVSITQSLGAAFGSGVLAGDTGIVLNNLLYWYDLDPASPNAIAPGKKIEMCMAPAAAFRDGRLCMVIGTPGSFGILETTPQMLSNVLDHGYSIQAAIEAPRFRTYAGTTIDVEGRVPAAVRAELARLGHDVRVLDDWSPVVGGGQGIMRDPDSRALLGGADPRRDGYALGW
ncbi:MAG TPA: gamma-glutamyltransferase [Thermomicrobiales bacterium]|nr:gamma-glutamyltransferase [Thermomicrobiales bacterium]